MKVTAGAWGRFQISRWGLAPFAVSRLKYAAGVESGIAVLMLISTEGGAVDPGWGPLSSLISMPWTELLWSAEVMLKTFRPVEYPWNSSAPQG